MPTCRSLLLIFACSAAAVCAQQRVNIEFNGVVIVDKIPQVSLYNPTTGTAKWVAVGGKFDGFIVKGFTPTHPNPGGVADTPDTVVLARENGNAVAPITLKTAVIVQTTAPQIPNILDPNSAPGMAGQPGQASLVINGQTQPARIINVNGQQIVLQPGQNAAAAVSAAQNGQATRVIVGGAQGGTINFTTAAPQPQPAAPPPGQ